MKYIALLRGINVGGKMIIKMSDLKTTIENCGFTNVNTYIQSGNIIFESNEKDPNIITTKLENELLKSLKYHLRIVVRTYQQLKAILSNVPDDWKTRQDMRCYLAFVKEPATAEDVIHELALKEGVDSVKDGEGVVYMSTLLSGLTKSGFTRLINKIVYKDITIRNYNTCQQLLSRMEL
jgi:uncharacterized protein (DUF1697 family)